jgi:hypothetical protein
MPLRDPEDRRPFAAMLKAIAELYGRDLSAAVVGMYWSALAPYNLAAVRLAFDRHARNPDSGQFMPKPADLIRMIDGGTADSAAAAWAKTMAAVRRVGGHESVVFDDPLIHRCVEDMGGWPKLCEGKVDDEPFRQRDFTTLYRGYTVRREIPPYPPRLIGRFEAANRAQGFEPAPPMLVGDQAACLAVSRNGTAGARLQITVSTEENGGRKIGELLQ